MSLIRRNRYNRLSEFDRMMNRMWSMLDDSTLGEWEGQHNDARPLAVDVKSSENEVIVRAALPGVNEDEIDINVEGNVLTISAETQSEHEDKQENWHVREMSYGKFARSIALPEDVLTDEAEASLENGILTVTLPKKEPNPARKIAVKGRQTIESGTNQA